MTPGGHGAPCQGLREGHLDRATLPRELVGHTQVTTCAPEATLDKHPASRTQSSWSDTKSTWMEQVRTWVGPQGAQKTCSTGVNDLGFAQSRLTSLSGSRSLWEWLGRTSRDKFSGSGEMWPQWSRVHTQSWRRGMQPVLLGLPGTESMISPQATHAEIDTTGSSRDRTSLLTCSP